MFIQEISQLTGVSAKTIRYYESIGLLPKPERAENNYRQYSKTTIERLRFIISARSLGFTLTDIGEFLKARDANKLPCQKVLDSFDQKIIDIDRRIADLLALRETISRIRKDGEALPPNKKCDEQCVCYLIEHEKEKI